MRTSSFTLYPSDAPHIARLNRHHAEVLALFRQNRNYEVLAQTVGVPIGTIKSRLARARAQVLKLRAQAKKSAEAA